ncbi:phage baseplate assembly protein V [Pseudochelatococcus sp. G4_1912]|uniref:phage baseplate assembly protein V n=1 Tax=Pseudochelatococcus sp. G4_1912 TaxID=3114288 RepID=UPI0039C72E90
MSDLAAHFARLNYRIAELERRDRNRSRIGTVLEVDPVKGQARVELANGFVSDWIPWQEQAAGAARTHFPLSIGQQVRVRSQNGDLTDAEIEASLPSDTNTRPSQKGDEYVLLEVGSTRIAVSDGGATASITVGSSTLTITDGNMMLEATEITLKGAVKIEGASVTHNGTNIGDTHIHGGVMAGPATTGVPAN